MLDAIFMRVIDMNKVASMIILIIIVARLFMKNAPKFVSYMLWSVVLFRLLFPISIESIISLVPEVVPTSYHYSLENEDISLVHVGEAMYRAVDAGKNDEAGRLLVELIEPEQENIVKTVTISWWEVVIYFGKYIWLLGIAIIFVYAIISYERIRKKVMLAIPFKDNIYLVDEIDSPFIMGFFQPKIYLPFNLNENEQEYIILHEQFHIRRLDHIVKFLAFLALCIHWFNPLVWIAFVLSGKDMEMSCDEAVIKRKGETIKADYAASLLALQTGQRMILGTPIAFVENETKTRIKNLSAWKMPNKKHLSVITICVLLFIVCCITDPVTMVSSDEIKNSDINKENTSLNISLNLKEHYITSTGDPTNLYYIDENHVLWGRGENRYGQLGQGTRDTEYHEEMVKIAENVVHVDYSQKGLAIYLTKDHKLYGFGNTGSGALLQYDTFDWDRYLNYDQEMDYVETPRLLMEDVAYACCGQDDIVCMKKDGSVWTWGTIYVDGGWHSGEVQYVANPTKILDNAVLVTGGWFHHAALLQDGTLWTWGYNYTGNCGVKDMPVVAEPTKAAEDVVMVWTGTMQNHIESLEYLSKYSCEYPRQLENTLIKKSDGSYWICGVDVGTEEKDIPSYYEVSDIRIICTHEFMPIENTVFSIEFTE